MYTSYYKIKQNKFQHLCLTKNDKKKKNKKIGKKMLCLADGTPSKIIKFFII